MQQLREDQVDMVFMSHSGPLEQEYASIQVAQLPIVCCTTKKNDLSRLTAVKPYDVANTPLVLFDDSFFQTEKIKKWFADHGINPKIILQTEQLSTMLSIIAGNIAAGFMFRQLAEENPKLIPIPIEGAMLVDVSLVWKKDRYVSSGMRRLMAYVKEQNPFAVE